MAAPVCTRASLAESNPGFGLAGLNPTQFKAAMIYFKVLELAAIGGTNYTAALTTTLVADAVALTKTMDPNQRRIAMLNIARNNAINAGASVPASVNALNLATACCLQAYGDLDALLILLECKLGTSKAYPQ